MLPIRTFNDVFDLDFTEKGNCDIYLEDGKYHVEMDLPGYNKEDIHLEGILKHDENEERQFAEYMAKEPHTTMDIMIAFFRMQMKAASSVCPQFYSDLNKYQNVLKAIAKKHSERDMRALEFFKKGVEEGYFRSDFDYTLLFTIVRQSMQYVMDSQLYKQYGTQHLFRNMIMLFIRGFATQKGIIEFDKALEEYE